MYYQLSPMELRAILEVLVAITEGEYVSNSEIEECIEILQLAKEEAYNEEN